MIVYNPRRWRGLVVLSYWRGPARSAVPYALVSLALALCIDIFGWLNGGEDDEVLIDQPAALGMFTTLLGFLLVIRGNLAYNRYWDARTEVQKMSVAWADLAGLAVAFDVAAKGQAAEEYWQWKRDLLHLLSLQHALAVLALRTDIQLRNLVEYVSYQDGKQAAGGGAAGEAGDAHAAAGDGAAALLPPRQVPKALARSVQSSRRSRYAPPGGDHLRLPGGVLGRGPSSGGGSPA
eukprot:SAG22_NODE_148_length_17459_cov_18.266359_6_plen_234_part_01